jgi:hypothetical protein
MAANLGWIAGIGSCVIVMGVIILFDTFVLPRIMQDFYIKINIINFDKRSWKIDSWYHDTGIAAEDQELKAVNLPSPHGQYLL